MFVPVLFYIRTWLLSLIAYSPSSPSFSSHYPINLSSFLCLYLHFSKLISLHRISSSFPTITPYFDIFFLFSFFRVIILLLDFFWGIFFIHPIRVRIISCICNKREMREIVINISSCTYLLNLCAASSFSSALHNRLYRHSKVKK